MGSTGNNKIIFLNHGFIKDDLSMILNRYRNNYALFVTSAERERESVAYGNYGYDPRQIILTGLPRYDLLYNDPQMYITVIPACNWKLCGHHVPEASERELPHSFEESDTCLFYTRLLTDQRFLSKAEEFGYKIRFLPHPAFLPFMERFKFDKRVEVLHSNVNYRKIFAESALISTDYSSAAFDFAYLKKPVVYIQFDKDPYENSYFNYERDGFGEVEYTINAAVDRLIEYMENDCRLKEKYARRIDSFFKFHDRKNCARVYREIRKFDLQEYGLKR